MQPPVVALRGISKTFGAQRALDGVSFEASSGEVHALAGENGAGKSTLIKILAGALSPDAGTIEIDGVPRRFATPAEARAAGVAVVYQELSLVPALGAADNLFLGRELALRGGRVDFREQRRRARAALAELAVDVDVDLPVELHPPALCQLVEIARGLLEDARVFVLDEPTSSLDQAEAERLYQRIEALAARGAGVILITHKMEEIERLAHRITVLRDGRWIGTEAAASLPRARLLEWMVGRELLACPGPRELKPAAPRLALADFSAAPPRHRGEPPLRDIRLTVRAGEICGIAGLQDSGGSLLLQSLFGATGAGASGRADLDGAPYRPRSPREALARGVAYLPRDRKAAGIVPDLSVAANTSLAALRRFSPRGLVDRARERRAAGEVGARLALAAPSLDAPISALSGGNQQKVLLARLLLLEPRLLLLDEPTRGVDVAARRDLYRELRRFAERGGSVLFTTTELEELQLLADRVLVLFRGERTAELAAADATPERVLTAAMGAREASP